MSILNDKDINELQDYNEKIWKTTDDIEKNVETDIQKKLGLNIHKSFNDVEISYIKASKLYSDTSLYIYYSMYLLFNIDKKNDDIATLTYKYISDDTKPVFNDSCINYISGFITGFLRKDEVMDNFYKFMALLMIKENNINTDEFKQKINEYYGSIQHVKYSSIKCFYIDINRDFSLEQYKGLKIPKKDIIVLFKNVYCNIEDLDNYIQSDVLNIPIYVTRLDTTRKIDDNNTEIVESIKTNSKEIKTIEFSPYLLSFSNQLFRNTKYINIKNFEKTQITKIEQSSFKKCTLDKLILPSELTDVETMAFKQSKINILDLSNTKVISLPTSTFLNAEINQLILPKGLTDVNFGAFACLKTNTLDLSNTKITSLPTSAFSNADINRLILPSELTDVKLRAFTSSKTNTLDLSKIKNSIDLTNIFNDKHEINQLILPPWFTYDESNIAKIALITTLKKLDITYTKLTLKDINPIHDCMPNVEIIKNKYITMGMYISF